MPLKTINQLSNNSLALASGDYIAGANASRTAKMLGRRALSLESSRRNIRSLMLASGSFPVMASPPTVTITNSLVSSITSPNTFGGSNSCWGYSPVPFVQDAALSNYYKALGGTALHSIIEFWCDDHTIELRLLSYNSGFTVEVNGELLNSGGYSLAADGSPQVFKIDWSGVRALRYYRICGQNFVFNGAWTTASGTVLAPVATGAPLMVFLGDSYTDGTGALKHSLNYYNAFGRAIGVRTWGHGVGGAGWNTTGTNAPATRVATHFPNLTEEPTAVILALGYNDAGGNMTTLAASHAATVDAVAAVFPNTRIWTMGPWTPIGGTVNLTLVKNALVTSAAAKSSPFIDIENVINSANKGTWTGGDNTHPNAAGHVYIGQRLGHRLFEQGLI